MIAAGAIRACEWCRCLFEPNRAHHVFCSAVCRSRACQHRYATGQNIRRDFACEQCGAEFSAIRRDRRFCSKPCCQRWHDARRGNRLAAEPTRTYSSTAISGTVADGANGTEGLPQ